MVAVVYCAYGDESRDESRKRVYAVAGVFGNQVEWDEIEIPWKERLGGKIFHAADCEFGHGEFAGMPHGECRKLYRDLTALVVNSKLCFHGVTIDFKEYFESFVDDFEDAPYLWAFGDVVQSMAELASLSIPPQKLADITFDNNEPIEHNATVLYNFMRHSPKVNARSYLADKLSFACRRTTGIQIADLIARETMKHLDARLSNSMRPTRLSFAALHDTKRFAFIQLGKTDFEKRKQRLASMSVPGATLTDYRIWLNKNRLQDCMTNRIEHLKLVSAQMHKPEQRDS